MNPKHALIAVAVASILTAVQPLHGQITSNAGDGVLNATYRGTINSLRDATMAIGYGETWNQVEPASSSLTIASSTIKIWVVRSDIPPGTEPWDRSVLRMYKGVDASGDEIDLTGTTSSSPATVSTDGAGYNRFSFRAMGTKTLAPQTFDIHFDYFTNPGNLHATPIRTVVVVPTTGSFHALPGLSEAFHFGTPILDVAVGNARLTVPVGRTATMIGQTFVIRNSALGPSTIQRSDVLLPGAAESVYIMNDSHFRLGGVSSGPFKGSFGTPWPGYLVGYHCLADIFAPDGTTFEALGTTGNLVRINYNRPYGLDSFNPASQQFVWDTVNLRVTSIRDQATPNNVITLMRNGAGVVTRITTSDGRGWNIQSDAVSGWITGVIPDGGQGARYFKYNAAGRVTQVRLGASDGGDPNNPDLGDQIMYKFVYDTAGDLREEWRFIDDDPSPGLKLAVEHIIVSEGQRQRKEYIASGTFRQFDLAYDTTATPPLNHRLKSMTAYSGSNGGGTSYTTTFTHKVGAPSDLPTNAGTMVLTQEDLPDGTAVTHEYDHQIDTPLINVGLRTKTTRTKNSNSLVTFDIDYEFFYSVSGSTRLFFKPRIAKQRDGRGAISEIVFDYENGNMDQNGDGANGELTNQLLSRTGPTITLGTSGTRTPQTNYTYSTSQRTLTRQETRFGSGAGDFRRIDYTYDSLLRLTSQAVDPAGAINSVTQYAYCDTAATQDRITADPDGYWTRRRFDNDGRVTFEQRFLNANPGSLAMPCANPSGPFYQTQYVYDTNGRLFQQIVDNKDQAGTPLTPAAITTQFTYDRLGRLTLRVVDPSGIGAESNFDYNWQGDVEREFDTSGRGVARAFEGRGLLASETPLALSEAPDNNLTVNYTYDSLGNRRFTNLPTGAILETVYDDFSRVQQQIRTPGPDGGNAITTTYSYDAASNVIRTVVDEATVGTLSDAMGQFDEGNFNYESRQRLTAGSDGSNDPVIQRKFDWAGNVTEDRSLGDSTVADRVITTHYDGANRVDTTTDSEGGQTTFMRDQRGNVTNQSVMLNGTDNAVTDTVYDALSRAIQITGPEDSASGRPDRIRSYDSRGNLLRESMRDAADVPKMTSVFGYNNAGRQTRQAVLANAASGVDAAGASVTTDRVTDFQYDADGRLTLRRTYNNNSSTPHDTTTTYDTLGRVDVVTDPSGSFADDNYATNGRLDNRVINDGAGSRTFTYAYDGHDRVITQTAVGTPNLVTSFALDGLDRQKSATDPRGLVTLTQYDLAGRRIMLTEDSGGAQQRQTAFGYNTVSQLITQTAMNATSGGGALPNQVTRFRYDSLGRMIRAVYPDNTTDVSESQIAGCTDCIRMAYDAGGRATSRTDQRGLVTGMTYDKRSLLLTRTTGADRDTFDYDALGRANFVQRGTTGNPDAVSSSVMAYNDLGDLDSEMQTLFEGTPRLVDYGYDQAGNRLTVTYPSGPVVGSTPTAINQVDALSLNAAPLADYQYSGHVLDKRLTTTATNGTYTYDPGYDSHRRVNSIVNSFTPSGGSPATIAAYSFTRDNNGNPLSQTASGPAPFASDSRTFTVDRLNRLTVTSYTATSETESQTLDHVGNRESHTPRGGSPTAYTLGNAANEYATIGGTGVTYDAAGNLTADEAGRQYFYDEQNRLTQIKASNGTTVLANYAYDSLGRRVLFEDPVAGITTRYYYDGPSVIEERDGSDVRVRYHVNGAQYVDEHVASFDDSSGIFVYYLSNDLYTVAAIGNASGGVIESYNYGAYGLSSPASAPCVRGDFTGDGMVTTADIGPFVTVLLTGAGTPGQLCAADMNGDFRRDGMDIQPFVNCLLNSGSCPGSSSGSPLRSAFTLHGRPVDVIDDGNLLLQYNRARYYDIRNARWLQRDPLPYNDGQNLYEPWRGNPGANPDPSGEGILTWILAGAYHASDWQFIKDGGPLWAAGGFFQGAGRTIGAGSVELGRTVGYPLGLAENPSASQLRLMQLVQAEYDLGGTASESPGLVMLRATGQGIADFFGASNVATAATGEVVVFGEGGQVFIVEAGGFERFQAGVAGAGQFAGTVSGLAVPALNSANQVIVGRAGLSAFTRLAPETPATRAFTLRAGLAIEGRAFAAQAAQASEAQALAVFLTRRPITPGTAQMEAVVASGRAGEFSARGFLESQGEIIVLTQFPQGAASRGFDFLSAARTPNGLEVFINEVRNRTGLQFPGGLTALGLNQARTFETNLGVAQARVAEQVTDNALRTGILAALRQKNYSIRIIGRSGIRITPRTEALIQQSTQARGQIVVLEALGP